MVNIINIQKTRTNQKKVNNSIAKGEDING